MFQRILEFALLVIAAIDGVGIGSDDVAFIEKAFPKLAVVELTVISLAGGVVDILDIGEEGDFIHSGISSGRQGCKLTVWAGVV